MTKKKEDSSPCKKQKLESQRSPGTDAGRIVPAQVPAERPTTVGSVAAPIVAPSLPTTQDAKYKCDVGKLMRDVVAFTRPAVVEYIKSQEPLRAQFTEDAFWKIPPLKIGAVGRDTAGATDKIVGHKHPWSKADAESSIHSKDMYEASINVDWVKPFCTSDDTQVLAGDIPTYEDVVNIVDTVFAVDSAALAASQGKDLPKEYRKSFPFVLATYMAEKDNVLQETFKHSLILLDGHAFVWVWWLHLFNLISRVEPVGEGIQAAAVRHHLDIGLSVSAQVRVEADVARLAVWSCGRSAMKQVTEKLGSDTFTAFAQKITLLLKDVPKKNQFDYLKGLNVSFQGAALTRGMYYAVLSCAPVLVGACAAVLRSIQVEFGRKAIAKGYTKLYNASRTIARVSQVYKEADTKALFLFVLEGILFELRYEINNVDKMTESQLAGTKNITGKVGVLLWKHVLVQYLASHATEASVNAGETYKNEVADLIAKFQSYAEFSKHFQPPPYALAPSQDLEKEDLEKDDKFEAWKDGKRKLTCDIADFLHDLFGGSHDGTLEGMSIEDHKDPSGVDWTATDIPVAAIINSLRLSGSQVSSAAAESAPPMPARALNRMSSDPMQADAIRQMDVERERNEVWFRAGRERMKYATFSFCKNWTLAGIKNHVAKLKVVGSFQANAGEQHRVTFASADLLGQDGAPEPWNTRPEWSEMQKVTMEAAVAGTAAGDVACLFDGGSRKVRREIEDIVAAASWNNDAEVTITFLAPAKKGTGGRNKCLHATTQRPDTFSVVSAATSGRLQIAQPSISQAKQTATTRHTLGCRCEFAAPCLSCPP